LSESVDAMSILNSLKFFELRRVQKLMSISNCPRANGYAEEPVAKGHWTGAVPQHSGAGAPLRMEMAVDDILVDLNSSPAASAGDASKQAKKRRSGPSSAQTPDNVRRVRIEQHLCQIDSLLDGGANGSPLEAALANWKSIFGEESVALYQLTGEVYQEIRRYRTTGGHEDVNEKMNQVTLLATPVLALQQAMYAWFQKNPRALPETEVGATQERIVRYCDSVIAAIGVTGSQRRA
jgi:hypothetical protein